MLRQPHPAAVEATMSVRIDAKPEVPTYQPPAWATETAQRDLAKTIERRSTAHVGKPSFALTVTSNRRPKSTSTISLTPWREPARSDSKRAITLIDRATAALIAMLVVYMVAQFVRAWLEGRL